jgi:hypothetical protein
MTIYTILGIIAIVFVVVIFFIFFHTTTSIGHTLVYNGKTLFTSSKPIVVSSDGAYTIAYATPKGVTIYNTETENSKIVNSVIATGIVYSEKDDLFMILEENGNISSLSRIGEKSLVSQGGQKMYDTVTGYYMMISDTEIYDTADGDKTPANGNYGLIQLTIT